MDQDGCALPQRAGFKGEVNDEQRPHDMGERVPFDRSTEVACSIQWELHNDPELKMRQIGTRVGLGEATIRSWMKQQSSPTLDSIRKVAEGMHPEGRYADPLEWLEAGRQYLNYLIARLEQLELWERRQAVRARLGPTAGVDEVLEVIEEEIPEELRGELLRRLRAGGKKEEARDDAGGGVYPR